MKYHSDNDPDQMNNFQHYAMSGKIALSFFSQFLFPYILLPWQLVTMDIENKITLNKNPKEVLCFDTQFLVAGKNSISVSLRTNLKCDTF
jgi:hypothetical protein